ncbi:MAG: hypothetical protein AVDCRST_MAG15-176, partial [uncultured Rubellimicrobium sp.]
CGGQRLGFARPIRRPRRARAPTLSSLTYRVVVHRSPSPIPASAVGLGADAGLSPRRVFKS